MPVKTLFAAVLLALLLAGFTATVHAEDDSVSAARDLYASAAYDDALKMLDGLLNGALSREDRQAISLYRALCFMALGRSADADRAIETLITQDPLYRPSMQDLPPRMRTTFTDARRRLLPGIIQGQYAMAKAAFDREEFGPASEAFKRVLDILGDSDIAGAANQASLSDLRVLATGFHDLSLKELELPPLPAPAPVVVATPPPAAGPARDYTRLYSADDRDVAHPGVIRQAFPPFPGRITVSAVGVIEVLIDASGNVESASITAPVHPLYDNLAVSAAKRWRYQPAMVDGVPVRFVKRVQITLAPTQ